MQAYPKPRFDWSFANSVLQSTNRGGPYAMNSTALGDDVYESVLTIYNIDHSSYGDYTCKSGKHSWQLLFCILEAPWIKTYYFPFNPPQ